MTTGIGSPDLLESIDPTLDSTGAKADTVLTVDLRTVPPGVATNIGIGLLEPGRIDSLAPLIDGSVEVEGMDVEARQLLLATCVTPWVAVTVHWIRAEPSA
jgi:hypothetical protein